MQHRQKYILTEKKKKVYVAVSQTHRFLFPPHVHHGRTGSENNGWASYDLGWLQHTYSRNGDCVRNWKCAVSSKTGEVGEVGYEKIIQFLGLTGSPYRSLLRIQYGVSIICKRVEKACSLLLQMKHSGGTLLYRFQIMSLDSNTNETGRVLVSIP